MKCFLLLLVMTGLTAAPAWAMQYYAPTPQSGGNAIGPCTGLPAAAAISVPAPFQRYMGILCYRMIGEGLRPVAGFHWMDQNGHGLDLTSASAAERPDAQGILHVPFSWYTRFNTVSLTTAQQATLIALFKRHFFDPDLLSGALVLELDAETSNAEEKRIFLILPDARLPPEWLVGYECDGACFTADPEPMLFLGEPN